MSIEEKYQKFINRKNMKDVKHLISNKQEKEIKDVLKRIEETGVSIEQLGRRIIPKMIKSGVSNLYVRRIARKKKYSPRGTSKYGMILLYGRKGYEYWESYKEKQAYTNSFDYKRKNYGWTKEDFENYNKKRAVTLKNLKKRHGEIEGLKKWKNYKKRQAYTNSIDYFIEKFGYENGIKEWKRINKEKSMSYENLMRKYQDEEKVKFILGNWMRSKTYSKVSQNLFIEIYSELPRELKEKTYFASLNKEFHRLDKNNNRSYFYDFVISNIKFAIEFNGDLYHANPKFYQPSDIPPFQGNILEAREIWKNDYKKIGLLQKEGFDVIIVWEDDFMNNKDGCIEKCIRRIYERYRAYK